MAIVHTEVSGRARCGIQLTFTRGAQKMWVPAGALDLAT